MAKSTATKKTRKAAKPSKPYDGFPLFAHASGKWCKTIRGKMFYFGKWADPQGALAEYEAVADDLHAGRKPTPKSESDGATIRDVCNAFIGFKRTKLDSNNLSPRTFVQYDTTCRLVIDEFGADRAAGDLGPADFAKLYGRLAKKFGVSSIGGQMTQVRSIFKFAVESELLDRPLNFGPQFKAPNRKELKKAAAKSKQNGGNLFEPSEIRAMLDGTTVIDDDGNEQSVTGASVPLRAMLLLAINGGYGNTDCASLPQSAIDFEAGVIDFPRPKTGEDRRTPLWPETMEALKAAIAARRKPADPDHDALVFLTSFGLPWVRYEVVEEAAYGKKKIKAKADDAISKQTDKLQRDLKLKRPGRRFYRLRHTFATIASGAKDPDAVRFLMGHADDSMTAHYQHGVHDDRLRAVVDHVREWLFGK